MLRATPLPLFRLTLVYISGILLAIYYPTTLFNILMLLLALSLLYLSAYIRSSHTFISWLHPIGLLLIFLVGYTNVLLHMVQQEPPPKWLETHQYLEGYQACITKVDDPLSCKALITHIRNRSGWHNSNRVIQLIFSKKSDYNPKKEDKLLIRGTPVRTLPPHRTESANHFRSLHARSVHRHVLNKRDQDFSFLTSEIL